MIGMQPAREVAKGDALVGRFLELARTEQSRSIPVEQQAQENFRGDRFSANGRIPHVKLAQIQLGEDIDHKARQVLGRQRFGQADGLVQDFFVIRGLEFSAHARSLPFNCLGFSASPTAC